MSEISKDRWISCFRENEKYIDLLSDIEKFCTRKTQEITPRDYFTPHDSKHCQDVENIIKILISKSNIELTELEIFLLFSCV